MAHPLDKVVEHIRTIAASHDASDGELLRSFVTSDDQRAFAALVKRHGPLVFAVCKRVLGVEDAEDAFQGTFVVLARNAAKLPRRCSLSTWLHGVAYRIALNARRLLARRRRHERQANTMAATNPALNAAWREVLGLLDEEIQRLPEQYREPFILCSLEGQSYAAAARRVGLKETTVRGRLMEARKRLQARLLRRGVELTAVLGAATLAPSAATAQVAPALVAKAVSAATGAAVPASVTALLKGLTVSLAIKKAKVGVALFLIVSATVGTTSMWAVQHGVQEKTPGAAGKQEAAVKAEPAVAKDIYGDPLPPGAIARLGTVRQRAPGAQLAVTADGKEVVTVDRELIVRRFDAATGELRTTAQLPRANSGWLVKLSPRGTYALLHRANGFELWDIAQGKRFQTLTLGDGPLRWHQDSFAFSPDESFVAFADSTMKRNLEPVSDRVSLWDLKTTNRRILWSGKTLNPQNYFNPVVAFSPDGKSLVACHYDGILRCWDVPEKLLWESARKLSTGLILFSADSRYLMANSGIGISGLTVWDAATGKLVETNNQPPKDAIYPVGVSPDGKYIAFEDGFEAIELWKPGEAKASRLPGPGPRLHVDRHSLQMLPNNVVFTPDGTGLIRRTGLLERWDVETGKPVYAQTESWGHMEKVSNVIFSPDGRHLASCSADGTVRLWDVAIGRTLQAFAGGRSDRLAFTSDGKSLLAMLYQNSPVKNGLRQWDVATNVHVRDFTLPEPEPSNVYYNTNDMDLRAPAGSEKVLLLTYTQKSREIFLTTWELANGKRSQKPIARSDYGLVATDGKSVFALLTPDGRSVLTLFEQAQEITLVDINSGKPQWNMQTDRVNDGFNWRVSACYLAISPGNRFAAAHIRLLAREFHDDLRVADMASGRQLAKLAVRDDAVFAFSPDDRLFGVASGDRIRLWETATWREIGSISTGGDSFMGRVLSISFSPDGRTLATGQSDSTILLWDTRLRSGASRPMLTVAEAESLWADLTKSDAARANAAIWRLVDDPGRAIPLLKTRLQAVVAPVPEVTRSLIADLNSDQFPRRDAAKLTLLKLGESAEPALRAALKPNPSLEMRKRLESLLERLNPSRPLEGDVLRGVRAVQVLERIGTPEARRVLQRLAGGVDSAILTRSGRESLRRMAEKMHNEE